MLTRRLVIFSVLFLVAGFLFFVPGAQEAFSEITYTSMIAATDFDVAKADVTTTATGILGIVFTLMVVGLIIAVVTR